MKILSWNVNGLRATLNKGFMDFLNKENPEIICLQETKVNNFSMFLPDYEQFWNFAEKKGYSGTAIFSKIKPLKVTYGINIPEHDKEGRVITLEFKDFFLVNVYVPNSGRGLLKLNYRYKWDEDFLKYINNLKDENSNKSFVICGDLNVAHENIDLKNDKANYNKTAGYTQTEIDGFENILKSNFIDTFRYFYSDKIEYSWWSYMFNSREKNTGWRIDYFLISEEMIEKVKDSFILKDVFGSDHCPVGIELKN